MLVLSIFQSELSCCRFGHQKLVILSDIFSFWNHSTILGSPRKWNNTFGVLELAVRAEVAQFGFLAMAFLLLSGKSWKLPEELIKVSTFSRSFFCTFFPTVSTTRSSENTQRSHTTAAMHRLVIRPCGGTSAGGHEDVLQSPIGKHTWNEIDQASKKYRRESTG